MLQQHDSLQVIDIPVLVINLKSQVKKWNKVQKTFQQLGFRTIHRIDAVNGKQLTTQQLDVAGVSQHAQFLLQRPELRSTAEEFNTLGAVGCYLSHMTCWEIQSKNELPMCIVVEDDVILKPQFMSEMQRLLSSNKTILGDATQFDMFAWGVFTDVPDTQRIDQSRDGLHRCTTFKSTVGYLMTLRGAQTALKYALPIEMHVDAYLSVINVLGKFDLWIPDRSLFAVGLTHVLNTTIQDAQQTCIRCVMPRTKRELIKQIFPIILGLLALYWIVAGSEQYKPHITLYKPVDANAIRI